VSVNDAGQALTCALVLGKAPDVGLYGVTCLGLLSVARRSLGLLSVARRGLTWPGFT
jgi:hypothetical protein